MVVYHCCPCSVMEEVAVHISQMLLLLELEAVVVGETQKVVLVAEEVDQKHSVPY